MKHTLALVVIVLGLVGCSQQESNTWICDSKTFTQDEKQSWADRVTLMRFIFDFTDNKAYFDLVSYPRLMDYVSIEDWHTVNDFILDPSNETSIHQWRNGGDIDIKV